MKVADDMRDAKLFKRPCPICGSNDRIGLKIRSLELPAVPRPFYWEMHDVVCKCCAFVYSAVTHRDDYITDYYRHTSLEVKTDYKSKPRSALVRRYAPNGGIVLELGSGVSGFRDFLGDDYKIDNLEIGDDLPPEKYDLTAAYFVLEHVSNPRRFVYMMRTLTKVSGYVIIEVPDFKCYPAESLFPEHLNHFTEFHLRMLLETCGLSVVECIYGHSRGFGMAMVALVKPDAVDEASQLYKGHVK